MNCAVHPDVPVAAYCRTCGKALCENCKRDVRGVIYCEDCLAARVQGTLPEAAAVPPGTPPPVVVSSGPSPGLAGVLSGLFPFGIGQVYCGQYAKGLAYMLIFAFLVWGASSARGLEPAFGVAIAFFYVFQIVDGVRTARALQMQQPAPDPLHVTRVVGRRGDTSNLPIGAVVLIVLGFLGLLHTLGGFYWIRDIWPAGLIALGIWLVARRWSGVECECPRCRAQGITWPAVLITVGVLWLISDFTRWNFDRTWPVLLIVIGACVIAERSAPMTGHVAPPPSAPTGPSGEIAPVNQEVRR